MMPSTPVHTVSGSLAARAPFDFAKTLMFMRRFSPMAGEQTITGDTLTKAMALNGHAVAFTLREAGSIERPELAYTLHAEHKLDTAEQGVALERVRCFLSLDDDLQPFYAAARQDLLFAPVTERFYGLHQPKFPSPFEIACWAVLTQRTPIPVARVFKERLVERFGVSINLDGMLYRAFPEARTLAAVDAYELAELVHNVRKAEYLAAVIRFFGGIDEQWLRVGPYDEVSASIRAIRGIGDWSASFILLRGVGRIERVPTMERALSQAAAQLYNYGEPLQEDTMRRIVDRYGTTQGYWAFYARIATNDGDRHARNSRD